MFQLPEKTEMKYLKRIFIFPVRGYQYLVSPLLGRRCCFVPSCSAYMIEAIQKHGVLKGGYLGVRRILRCHPWAQCAIDPVPESENLYSKSSSDTKVSDS